MSQLYPKPWNSVEKVVAVGLNELPYHFRCSLPFSSCLV